MVIMTYLLTTNSQSLYVMCLQANPYRVYIQAFYLEDEKIRWQQPLWNHSFRRTLFCNWGLFINSQLRHHMETLSSLLALCEGNPPVDFSPYKSQWPGALRVFFSSAPTPEQTVSRANNRDAGNLRRHRAHYDATVIWRLFISKSTSTTTTVLMRWFEIICNSFVKAIPSVRDAVGLNGCWVFVNYRNIDFKFK